MFLWSFHIWFLLCTARNQQFLCDHLYQGEGFPTVINQYIIIKYFFFKDSLKKILKSVFPQTQVRTWVQVIFRQKQASDWLTNRVYQLEACFFGRKPLELISWLGSQKKLTLLNKKTPRVKSCMHRYVKFTYCSGLCYIHDPH